MVKHPETIRGALSDRPYSIGEESYAAGSRPPLTDAPTFCVDPIGKHHPSVIIVTPSTDSNVIDGTTNFVHGFPYACVSIGLIDKRKPVLGVIYNPFLDSMYTGVKGQGSHLTQRGQGPLKLPLAVPRPLPSLSQALIGKCSLTAASCTMLNFISYFSGIEWGSDRSANLIRLKGDAFMRLAGNPKAGVEGGQMAHSLRSLGSAALNFSMVAQGGLDLYWWVSTTC